MITRVIQWKGGLARAFAAGLLLLTSGCQSFRDEITDQHKPFFQPENFSGAKQLPVSLRRVLVLPVYGGKIAEVESTLALDEVLLSALQKKARFEVVSVSREEIHRRFGQPEFSSAAVLPRGFLEKLGEAYGADAVLFVDLTQYQPYPPLSVGFRAKLATIQDVRLIWTFDQAFSSADPAVINSVQRAGRQDGAPRSPVDMTVGTFQSPRRFAAYAADAMFDTIPPR